jgi:hypothetical protein
MKMFKNLKKDENFDIFINVLIKSNKKSIHVKNLF